LTLLPLTPKQRDFIIGSQSRVNLLHGSVRSGKSIVADIRFLEALIRSKSARPPLIVGRTQTALERNVLDDLRRLVGTENFDYKRSLKLAYICGRPVLIEGANDESAYTKIAGSTLPFAYVDEGTLIPESFWNMLISRLSEPGAQLFGTMNPGGPGHYLKRKWIDREADLDLRSWHFSLEDNTHLDPAYVAELKRQYTGLFYDRYIRGLWVQAEGAIYRNFRRDLHCVDRLPEGKPSQMVVGVDWGATHPTAYLRALRYGTTWYIDKEYRRSDLTNGELARDLQAFLGELYPSAILVDPSAKSFRLELLRAGVQMVMQADNDVLNGLSRVSNAFETGALKLVEPNCPMTLEELEGYRWDDAATERGLDKPVKEKDDLMDALRYIGNKIFTRTLNYGNH
jgi:PBSX family phage terminase large subunit